MLGLGSCFDIIEGFAPVDLQTAANNGDYVSLANAGHVAVVFQSGLGTAGDDPTLTIQQASDNAGTGAKALNFTTIYRKQAATSLAATSAWTKTTQTAANTYTNATSAEQDALWVVEFDADQLDVDGGFDYIRATVADIGANPQPGVLLYILSELRHKTLPADVVSAL